MNFGTVKCQLCTRAHIQHSRHEVRGDKSAETEVKVPLRVHPSQSRKKLNDSLIWNYKESIHPGTDSLARVKTDKKL